MVIALTEVPSEALKEVLRGLHRGTLEAPLTAEGGSSAWFWVSGMPRWPVTW